MEKMNKVEFEDMIGEVEQMVNNGYLLIEAIDHIAGCYEVDKFQLGLWYADYKRAETEITKG